MEPDALPFHLEVDAPLVADAAPERAARGTPVAAGFVVLNVLAGTASGVMQLAVPLHAVRLEATNAEIGALRAIAGLGMLLLVLPVGFLVDRFGPRKVFRVGGVAGAAVAAAIAFADKPLALILLMGTEGLLGPLRFTALNAAFFSCLGTIGREKAGWFKGSMSIGLTFLGPLVAGFLARSAGFRAVFGVVVALQLLSAVVVSLLVLDDRGPRAAPPARGFRDQLAELASVLRERSIRPVVAAEMLGAACFSAFSAFVVVVAVRELGAGPLAASQILVIEGAAFILTSFLAGGLAARRVALRRLAGAIAAAGALGTALAPGPAALAAAGAVLGVGLGLVHVLVSSRLGELRGARGKISSLFQASAGLGITVGPLACALASRAVPAHAVLVIFVPFFLVLAFTPHEARSRTMALEKNQIPQYLHETPLIVLSTVDETTGPATRVLASFAADGLTVYFSTSRSSEKVRHLGVNRHVAVLFQHDRQELPSFRNVEIRGEAEPVSDERERARAIQLIGARNPRFRERAEKGELGDSALFRVTPRLVKVVDLSQGRGPSAVTRFAV
ncbi:MFS transporter [Anaeromyxobacter oryzae]|uniref:Major facilitator superfamily (MFS) profile domain-containing protein n=1 Tax=Anaeromyxobacter oryzae TaxID=2918170 RepID=A0ABM7WSI2_9BACT|nr:MFS transporter [Anaeromyxobacter oryzae]BDG02383.1 hypothetical protein AMOR_13790 [Anaeromyxobacter oryzae]